MELDTIHRPIVREMASLQNMDEKYLNGAALEADFAILQSESTVGGAVERDDVRDVGEQRVDDFEDTTVQRLGRNRRSEEMQREDAFKRQI